MSNQVEEIENDGNEPATTAILIYNPATTQIDASTQFPGIDFINIFEEKYSARGNKISRFENLNIKALIPTTQAARPDSRTKWGTAQA